MKNSYKFLSSLLACLGRLTILALFLTACNLPAVPVTVKPTTAPVLASQTPISPGLQPTSPSEAVPTEQPLNQSSPMPEATDNVFMPKIENPNTPEPPANPEPAARLAFLKGGDIFLVDVPSMQSRPITQSANLVSFAWSPDGSRLATFDGHKLCFIREDGSSDAQPCVDLGLDDMQATIERRIVWSPDQKAIVLWNPVNPWDEGAIGWLYVALDGSGLLHRIDDPVDWGMNLAPNNDPGGITGQPLFLPDGSLIGTLTHRWLCGDGSCHFQLFSFDPQGRSFIPYPNKPEEGWSEGMTILLSRDGQILLNFGAFSEGCEAYFTFMDLYNLGSQTRQLYDLDQEAVSGIALSPDGARILMARTAGCNQPDPANWSQACGLSPSLNIYSMQMMDLTSGQRSDTFPGITPEWSPDGGYIAFRSCLSQSGSGNWDITSNGPPGIFIMAPDGLGISLISDGVSPQWKPTHLPNL
ncbi:MAG: PD40 domain-containing protein [Anaerolineales bacterium]|nr:PD40 domain-containing protein [Anaerolineales bacterium]